MGWMGGRISLPRELGGMLNRDTVWTIFAAALLVTAPVRLFAADPPAAPDAATEQPHGCGHQQRSGENRPHSVAVQHATQFTR